VSDDPFHFLLGTRDDACGFAIHFHPLGTGPLLDRLADAGK
jgi:hypothetical protein